jgi:hypothetical protein
MNIYKLFIAVFAFVFISLFTGCYTEVATTDSSGKIENEDQNSPGGYYSDDQESKDSGYYSETDTTAESNQTTIINKYYYGYPYYPYYYDYYPTITVGIGFGWGWGYCGWYPYWPYYGGWCGYGWYDPYYYYSYYPGYYYYYPPYYYPYYGYGYSYYDGYKVRNDYVSRLRNNSGGRNYGTGIRDPINTVSVGSLDRNTLDLTRGRDLQVSSNSTSGRNLGIRDKGRDLTRDDVNVDQVTSRNINDSKNPRVTDSRKDVLTTEKNSGNTRNNKQLGLTVDASNKKYLGIREQVNDVQRQLGIRNKSTNEGNVSKNTTNRNNPNYTNNKPSDNQNTGKNNNPRTYSGSNDNNKTPNSYNPPKRNETPRSYSPPKTNTNTPRSYSPPSNNTPPRTNSTPNRSGGNTSGRRR